MNGHSQGGNPRRRLVSLVAGGVLGVLAVVMLVAGAWGLSKDRFGRDADGFLPIVTGQAGTDTYALVSELRGDGPGWLYGSTVMGTGRFLVTSQSGRQLFVGIGPTGDVSRYLEGAGYATIDHLDTGALTAHPGRAPAQAPARLSIWAASTAGSGRLRLDWEPPAGDWSIVVMNADASAGVGARGEVSATVPILPWLALGLLAAAAALGAVSAWLLVRGIRAAQQGARLASEPAKKAMVPPVTPAPGR